jgi:hypothetical protein
MIVPSQAGDYVAAVEIDRSHERDPEEQIGQPGLPVTVALVVFAFAARAALQYYFGLWHDVPSLGVASFFST